MKSILVTGVGGAAGMSVLQSLVDAGEYHLVGVDADRHARGQFLSDEFFVIPFARDDRFIPQLLEVSSRCDALFCTVDEELPLVAAAIDLFRCKVFVPEQRAVVNCIDKLMAARTLEEHDIPTARTWPYDRRELAVKHVGFPLVVKPRIGRGSTDVHIVRSERALEAVGNLVEKELLVQEHLPGPEYTVDALSSEQHSLLQLVARERVRMKGGVSMVARTVSPSQFLEPMERICRTFKLRYIVNVQFRSDPPRVIEVSPRPAGTMIVSTRIGLNLPHMLISGWQREGMLVDYPENVYFYRRDENMTMAPVSEEASDVVSLRERDS